MNGATTLAVGVLAAVLLASPGGAGAESATASVQKYRPPICVTPATVDLAGTWQANYGLAGASIEFAPRADGDFDVRFSTWGCFAGDNLKRRARVRRGAVVFDRPVREYIPISYSRLWILQVGAYSEPILVPPQAEEEVRRAFAAGGCRDFGAIFESMLQFRKQRPVGLAR